MNSVSGVSQLRFVSHRLRQPKLLDEPSSATYPSCHMKTKIQQIMNHNQFLGSTQEEKYIRVQFISNCCFTFITFESPGTIPKLF